MHNPKVSIIIPVRNAEATIGGCIDSVLSQTYQNKELILVDGLSDDETQNIVQKYIGKIACYLREKDNGIYNAINKGIGQCKGDWIYILGADDCFADLEVLEKIFALLHSDVAIIFGNVRNENAKNRLVSSIHKSTFSDMLLWKNTLHQQGVFYHKSVFSNFLFCEELKVLADYDLHLKLRQEKSKFIAFDWTIAHCQAQGLSKQFGWSLYREELRMKRKRLSWWLFLTNIPVVMAKYVAKNLFG